MNLVVSFHGCSYAFLITLMSPLVSSSSVVVTYLSGIFLSHIPEAGMYNIFPRNTHETRILY